MNRYQSAKEIYQGFGVDTEAALAALSDTVISVHCWQGDDVIGFDGSDSLSGGIQATGNYPGRASTPEQLMSDMKYAFDLIPGKKKLNLHACYAFSDNGEIPERDKLEPRHFAKWVEFAKENCAGIDFNPTFFSHPMVKDDLTLSSPDDEVRDYWVRHGICCLKLAEHFARETGYPSVINFWIPDGYKQIPADRYSPRARFKDSLDRILATPYDKSLVYVTLESKVFGIGLENYTVGSAEFCLSYSSTKGITPLMDNGHYHPTEAVSDKIPSLLLFNERIALHITHAVRWDSDHVVLFDDETREIAKEIVRCNALDRVFIATDYFDASINRISAWVTGVRSVQKALLYALLQPSQKMAELQSSGRMTELMALDEELKCAPFGDIWNEYLDRCGVQKCYIESVMKYEREVLTSR